MNLLAFDTSTEALSVGLAWRDAAGAARQLLHTGPGGAQASATLIPAALELLRQAGLPLARLDAIVFGQGPGSFTGLRTACAVAQGLAYGAGVPVLPVPTLLAVAEDARLRHGADDVLAVLDARMDEVYAARWRHAGQGWQPDGPLTLGKPEALAAQAARQPLPPGCVLAGNAHATYGTRLPAGLPAVDALPTAQALLRLAPALLAAGGALAPHLALPLYIRDKVAQTTAERAAARAAAHAPAPATPAA